MTACPRGRTIRSPLDAPATGGGTRCRGRRAASRAAAAAAAAPPRGRLDSDAILGVPRDNVRVALSRKKFIDRDSGLFQNGSESALRYVAGVIDNGGLPSGRPIRPDLMRSGGVPVEFESHHFELSHDLSVTETGKPAHQVPTISGYSRVSPTGSNDCGCDRSARASMSFFATSRAISTVSATVRPCATKPGQSSAVAR